MASVVNSVFKLLGWAFAEEGTKAAPFASTAHALGVSVDVSEMHMVKAWIDNTESKGRQTFRQPSKRFFDQVSFQLQTH